MLKFLDRGLEHLQRRRPYAIPAAFAVVGLAVLAYAGSMLWEWHELSRVKLGPAAAGEIFAGAQAAAESGGALAELPPEQRLRLRRGVLVTGGAVLAVLGTMSLAYSWFWFRVARLRPVEDDEPPPRLN